MFIIRAIDGKDVGVRSLEGEVGDLPVGHTRIAFFRVLGVGEAP